jgi:hypothetical protein
VSSELRDRDFHVMEFAHHEEAAAFAAALSRFLNSPSGGPHAGKQPPAEVWAESPATGAVRLFLSNAALAAAQSAFSPVPVGRTVKRAALPAASFLVIEGGKTPSWGAADAADRLARPDSSANAR